jgi:hypothetical protein
VKTILLKETLQDWEDADIARYCVACALGFVEFDSQYAKFGEFKGVFWTPNPVSDFLEEILDRMVEFGFLERNEDFQYRYSRFPQSISDVAYRHLKPR